MKLVAVTMFGIGYVLGTKAGRERYEQIRRLARNAPKASTPQAHGNGSRLWPPSLMGILLGQHPGAHPQRRTWCPDQAASSILRQAPSRAEGLRLVPSGFADVPAKTLSRAI